MKNLFIITLFCMLTSTSFAQSNGQFSGQLNLQQFRWTPTSNYGTLKSPLLEKAYLDNSWRYILGVNYSQVEDPLTVEVSDAEAVEPAKNLVLHRGRSVRYRVKVYFNSGSSKLCLLYTSPSPRDQRGSRMPSSA